LIRRVAEILEWTAERLMDAAGQFRVSPTDGQAWIYHSGAEHRLINDAEVGQPSGVASLDIGGLVPSDQLGTGGTGAGTRFLADDQTWKAGGGGGVTDHTALTNLLWPDSDHTGTPNRAAGFDGSGAASYITFSAPLSLSGGAVSIDLSAYLTAATAAATYLTIATAAATYQPLDAGLTSLLAADTAAGLLYTTGAATWARASLGDLAVNAGAWEVTQARALRESGGTTLTMGAVADGELLRRSGTTVAGIATSATPAASIIPIADSAGTLNSWIGADIKGVRSNVIFVYVLPQAGTSVNLDGSGPTVSTGGILTPSQSEADYFCTQFGDAGAFYARWYVVGGYRTNQGTIVLNFNFGLGSDTTGSTQYFFAGLSNTTTLAAANPSTGTVDMGCIRYDVGTANFKLFTKDNVTGLDTDTGVAVTPSYYYMVQMTFTSSSCSVKIGRGSTPTAAATDFLTAATTSSPSNLPRSTVDLNATMSLHRGAGSTNRRFRFNYFRMTITPSWAA